MSVKKILDDMDYGLAPESPEEVKKWLLEHNSSFGHFIGGKFTKPKNEFISVNPSNGEFIASLSQASDKDVNNAVKTATPILKISISGGYLAENYSENLQK